MNQEKSHSTLISLVEKAADTTAEGITVSTMLIDDKPLIYANEGFERLTGYSREEVLGKNCRFLQGKDTETAAVEKIRETIQNGIECTIELLNYKKNGTPFWNRLSLTPIINENNQVTHYVGVQSDITELKETKKKLEIVNKDLSMFHKKITAELDQASKAQQFILPENLPSNHKIKFSARFEPMDQIGGDFYDIIELKSGVYGILIADVTGHGIPAALLTYMTSFAFKNSALNIYSTSQVISETNNTLFDRMPIGTFVTMFYAIYDSNNKVLTYTQAGHPKGFIICSSTKKVIPLSTKGGLVGIFSKDEITYEESSIELQIGDKLILYTDAIIESRKANDQMLEMDNLVQFLELNHAAPISKLFDMVYQFGIEFSGNLKYNDDFTLVGFEVLS